MMMVQQLEHQEGKKLTPKAPARENPHKQNGATDVSTYTVENTD